MANDYNDGFDTPTIGDSKNDFQDKTISANNSNINNNSGQVNNGYGGFQNRGQMNNGFQNRGQMNNGFQNGGQINNGFQNRGQMNNGFQNRGQMNNGFQNRGQMNNGFQNRGQMNNGYGGSRGGSGYSNETISGYGNNMNGGYGNSPFNNNGNIDVSGFQQYENNDFGNNGNQNGKQSNKILIIAIGILVVAIAVLLGLMIVLNNDNNDKDDTSTTEATTELVTQTSNGDNKDNSGIPTQVSTQPTTNKKMVTVPSYVNQDYTSAKSSLESMGLVVKVEYKESSSTSKGKVISQDYSEGSSIEAGSTVTLTVSSGSMYSPYPYSQKITVKDNDNNCYGTLKLYDWVDGDWSEKFSCDATVGKSGIGSNYGEGKSVTPKGTFKIGTVLVSYVPTGNVSYNYYLVNDSTCIVDDTSSPYYNTVKDISSLPYGTGYDPIGRSVIANDGAKIIIEHNGNCFSSDGVVSGNGSAITICGVIGVMTPTYGCVDISLANMNKLLTYLDQNKNPYIEIG